MALTFDFEEEYRSSRPISITEDSFQQDFVFFLCGNFYETAAENIATPAYGPDDDLLALQAAYQIIPPYRTVPLYLGGELSLTLSSLNIEQMSPDVWKVSASYAVKSEDQSSDPNAGASAGAAAGDYEQWSNNFVQLGFNVSAQQEHSTMSLAIIAAQKNTNSPNQTVPFPAGKRAPVGLTNERAEGYDRYVRGFSFSLTAYFPPSKLTFRYVRRLFRMATTFNNDTFFGFPAGSVLFLEAQASGDVFSTIPVTFDFEMRPNFKFSENGPEALCDPNEDDPNLMFDVLHDPWFPDANSGGAPGGAYSGWSVVDYAYAAKDENSANLLVHIPILRQIHRIYGASNFARLEL
jgi:hypothetical protein